MPFANNKGADQPAHSHSLISAFVVRCLDRILSLVSILNFAISWFSLASVLISWAGRFESYLVENPKDRFSHDEARIRKETMKGSPGGATIKDRSPPPAPKWRVVKYEPCHKKTFRPGKAQTVCSATEASKSLQTLVIANTGIVLAKQWITKRLMRLHRCAGWSASLLCAYGINRFSHDEADMIPQNMDTQADSQHSNEPPLSLVRWSQC